MITASRATSVLALCGIAAAWMGPDSVTAQAANAKKTTEPPAYRLVTNLPWVRAPTRAEVKMAYPDDASDVKASGLIVLRCALGDNGRLSRCETKSDDAGRWGLAEAAKVLSRTFVARIDAADHDLLASVRVDLPIRFGPPPSSSKPRYLDTVEWLKAPRADAVMEAFPAKAADAGVTEGRASIDCAVHANGQLGECVTRTEEPQAMEFGAAAVQIGNLLVVNPWTDDGMPAEGARVRFSIKFVKAPDPAPSPPAKPQ